MNVDAMTRNELREYAKTHKLAGYSKLRVNELRKLVAEHVTGTSAAAVIARPYNGGRIYPTGPLGTYCNDPQLATHLPGFREDR